MTEDRIGDDTLIDALDAGRREVGGEFRAEAVRYLPERDAIEVITVRDGGFVVPRRLIGVLRGVDPKDLCKMEIWPDGSLIEIEALDIHISVDGMVKAALPVLVPSRIVAGMFAASGGAATSAAKAESSRRNGKKGGRPRKVVGAE